MARWWKPDAEFLERLSKKAMGNVMRGLAVAEDRIASMQKLLKHEAVHRTEAEISGSGYMPECLTAPQLGTDEDNTGEDRAEVEEDEGTVYAEAAE